MLASCIHKNSHDPNENTSVSNSSFVLNFPKSHPSFQAKTAVNHPKHKELFNKYSLHVLAHELENNEQTRKQKQNEVVWIIKGQCHKDLDIC